MATYDNLNEKGYIVVPSVLTPDELSILKKSLMKKTVNLIFNNQGFNVDPEDPQTPLLFTDMKLREQVLGEEGKTAVWKDGNTRRPIISKSCGMAHVHYDEILLELITYNPRLYEEAVKIMGTKNLVHSYGPERICIKSKGSTDMPKHCDANFFNDEVNPKYRIQCLVTIEIDTKISPRDSGTLCLLTYFHHYWDFVRELLHPLRGLVPMKEEMMDSRFFVLPMSKKDQDHFDLIYLPCIKKHAKQYAIYLECGKVDDATCEEIQFYKNLKFKKITVPDNDKKYIEMMDWTPIKLNPGDMVFWHQYLPHFSVRNKSTTPRICAYYGLYPVDEDYYRSEQCKWVQRMFRKCEFYYEVNLSKYPTNPVNEEEVADLKNHPGEIKRISSLSTSTQFRRRISSQESWWSKEESITTKPILKCPQNNLKKGNSKKVTFEDEMSDERVQLVFQTRYWSYAPQQIPNSNEIFLNLLPQLEKVCKTTMIQMYGKTFPSKKVSVMYADNVSEIRERADAKSKGFDYKETPAMTWKKAPKEILEIRKMMEEFYEYKFDYVLCHIYRGDTEHGIGKDYIGPHNDKEALDSEIVSVSLGATRRFQIHPIDDVKSVVEETRLKCGDVVHMHGPREGQKSCQRKYKHSVPEMNIGDLKRHLKERGVDLPKGRKTYKELYEIIRKHNIAPTRINLTFRQYED